MPRLLSGTTADVQSRITVVMATYNGSQFLEQQLMSLSAQSLLPVELVVADDCSTDATVEIVRAFAARAAFPVHLLINEENLGYGENFLRACRTVTTDFIALSDQDDVWSPHKLAVAQSELVSTGASLFVHGADLITAEGARVGRFNQGIRRRSVVPPLTSNPWGVLYGFTMTLRRDLLEVFDPGERGLHTFEHRRLLSHDLWIYFLATTLGTVVARPESLASYRQHTHNQTPHLRGRVVRRWTASLGKAVDPELPRNEIAWHRVGLLEGLAQHSPADRSLPICSAVQFWRSVARREDRRLPLYHGSSIAARSGHWVRLLFSGGYGRHRDAGLGWRIGLKDLLAGVLRLRRSGAVT